METVEYDDWPFGGERRDERMATFDQSDAASAKRKRLGIHGQTIENMG